MSSVGTGGGMDINPPSRWVRWRLGMEVVPDGNTVFAKEERILRGDSTKAELDLLFNGKAEGGKHVCNVCCLEAKSVCGNCHSRRYCSKACQEIDWKSGHKKICSKKNAIKDKKTKPKEVIEMLKKMCENPPADGMVPISFDVFMKTALKNGIITQDVINAEREGNVDAILKSYDKKLEEKLYELFFEIQQDKRSKII